MKVTRTLLIVGGLFSVAGILPLLAGGAGLRDSKTLLSFTLMNNMTVGIVVAVAAYIHAGYVRRSRLFWVPLTVLFPFITPFILASRKAEVPPSAEPAETGLRQQPSGNRAPGSRPKKTGKSRRDKNTWENFFLRLSTEELSGITYPPQLILCCRTVPMADRLVHGLPESAVPLLADAAETITFADGKSAVRFLLRSGKDIADFLGHVTRGDYGPERLAITNGIALRLPVSDRQSILQSIGIPRILAVGTAEQAGKETFIWW